ncbi:hypothetical protein SDC9_171894 [bioreactor metagenome]|uniref:Uncharacterized protein n=1 Tax=bioreactor metagenome TaxID=1076179 RepID=A0A645GCT6_9ZZZZ
MLPPSGVFLETDIDFKIRQRFIERRNALGVEILSDDISLRCFKRKIEVEKDRTPFERIVRRPPIFLVEHIAVADIRLRDKVIRKIIYIDPLGKLGKHCIVAEVFAFRKLAYALDVFASTLDRGLVPADELYRVAIHAIVRLQKLAILIFVEII